MNRDDAISPIFLVSPAELDTLCSGLFFHMVKFNSLIFMHKIFNWMVCVHFKEPRSYSTFGCGR